MRARQVVRDERGQEVMLSFGSSPAKFGNKENGGAAAAATTRIPDYLDAEEPHDPEADKKAVARVGGSAEAGNGWFSSIGGAYKGSCEGDWEKDQDTKRATRSERQEKRKTRRWKSQGQEGKARGEDEARVKEMGEEGRSRKKVQALQPDSTDNLLLENAQSLIPFSCSSSSSITITGFVAKALYW